MTDLETNALKQQAKDLLRQMPIKNGKLVGATSYMRRKLGLDFHQGAALMELLEVDGFITQADDDGLRTLREWEKPVPAAEESCLMNLPHIQRDGEAICSSCGTPLLVDGAGI